MPLVDGANTTLLISYRVSRRNEERKAKAASEKSKNADKIGYVPRNKQSANLNTSGLTSAGMMGGRPKEDPLDAESAAGLAKLKETDAEIDAGIESISRTIDNLGNLAGSMKDEVNFIYFFANVCNEFILTCFFNFYSDGETKPKVGKDRIKYAKDNRKASCSQCSTKIFIEINLIFFDQHFVLDHKYLIQ